MSASRIIGLIFGVLLGVTAAGLLFGGIGLLVAAAIQADRDGFLTSPSIALATTTPAITSEEVPLASHPGDWLPVNVATVQLNAASTNGKPVFIGLGPSAEVATYLAGVARDVVTEIGRPADIAYRRIEGSGRPAAPAEQAFWVASSGGSETAELTWPVARGDWTVAILNADGSEGVSVVVRAGVQIGLLGWIGAGFTAAGILLAAAAAAVLVWAVRRSPANPSPASLGVGPLATEAGPYPAVLEGVLDPQLSRWMWLVKWLLAIPHFLVLAILWPAFVILTIVAFFAILFTGRYPRGIFDFNVGVLRWSWRVGFYAFSALGTDRYPPFTLADADYPARFDVAYPEQLSRGLVLVKSWLLAIPHLIIVGILTNGIVWRFTDVDGNTGVLDVGGGIIGILAFVAGLVLLFSGQYPRGLFDLIMGLNRWVFRVAAYVALMRDEYPPFRLDLGGREPDPAPASHPRPMAPA